VSDDKYIKGRGSVQNLANRFERISIELDPVEPVPGEDERPLPRTQFYVDASKTVLTSNDSPDIPFNFSVNAYRGCEHGCAYCYARPTHEYLGMSAGLDFETKIFVKQKAPELLREKLTSRSWVPEPIAFSGVTDCYQPAERQFQLTRRCLEVLAEFKNPATLITKNKLITRDIDVLKRLAEFSGVLVFLSVTTLDHDLCGELEPRTSRPSARLEAIEELAKAGIPVGVNVAPVIPGLTDHEMPAILKASAEAGATQAGYTPLRLPLSVSPLFEEWLTLHRPERKDKVLNFQRSLRGGKLNDSQFGSRMRGNGAFAENLKQMFRITCSKLGLNKDDVELSTSHFKRPTDQMSLFD
jgi:DNA repair photolyase